MYGLLEAGDSSNPFSQVPLQAGMVMTNIDPLGKPGESATIHCTCGGCWLCPSVYVMTEAKEALAIVKSAGIWVCPDCQKGNHLGKLEDPVIDNPI